MIRYESIGTQGRRQGVCLRGGGGWQNVLLSTAPAMKRAISGSGGGGGDFDTFFFSTEIFCGKIITIMGYRVSSSPYVTELTSKKKKAQTIRVPPPATPSLTPRLFEHHLADTIISDRNILLIDCK